MRLIKIIFLLSILMLSSCRKDEIFEPTESEPEVPSPENVDERLINGTVNDDLFSPLPGVTVSLFDADILVEKTQTDENGEFYFIADDSLDYLVYIESPEYSNVLTTANPATSNNEVNVNLQISEGLDDLWNIGSYDWITVTGIIKNADGSAAINKTALCFDITGIFFNYISTDDSGAFTLTMPADIPVIILVDQICSVSTAGDFIVSDVDITIDDIIIENEIESLSIEGSVINCNGNPVEDGEIVFYESTSSFGRPLVDNVLGYATIADGFYSTEIENVCSHRIEYEAIDNNNDEFIYNELVVSSMTSISEDIEICNEILEKGSIDLQVDNASFILDYHYALEFYDHINIFGIEQNSVNLRFQSDMSEGIFDVESLHIFNQGQEYFSYGLELDVEIQHYPQNNQDNIIGIINGEIYDSSLKKVPLTLSFDLPLF